MRYTRCPMCGSRQIALGRETLHLKKGSKRFDIVVRRWACPKCGEKFLTADSRAKVDALLVPIRSRRRIA